LIPNAVLVIIERSEVAEKTCAWREGGRRVGGDERRAVRRERGREQGEGRWLLSRVRGAVGWLPCSASEGPLS